MKEIDNKRPLYAYLVRAFCLGILLCFNSCVFKMEQTYFVDTGQTCTCYQNIVTNNNLGIEENLHVCMDGYEEFIDQLKKNKEVNSLQLDSLNRSYLDVLMNELTKKCEAYRYDYRSFVSTQFFAPDSIAVELLQRADSEGVDSMDVYMIQLRFAAGRENYAYNLLTDSYLDENPKDHRGWWIKGAMEYELGMYDKSIASLDRAMLVASGNQVQRNLVKYYQNAISTVDTTGNRLIELKIKR